MVIGVSPQPMLFPMWVIPPQFVRTLRRDLLGWIQTQPPTFLPQSLGYSTTTRVIPINTILQHCRWGQAVICLSIDSLKSMELCPLVQPNLGAPSQDLPQHGGALSGGE